MLKSSRNVLSVVSLLFAVAVGYWSAQTGALAAPAKNAVNAKLNSLLQERLTTLREAAAITSRAYETGIESFVEVMAANQAVHQAELDLCSTDKERIAIIEKMVSEAKNNEVIAAQQVARGAVPSSTALRAKANRLETEIGLERLKNK